MSAPEIVSITIGLVNLKTRRCWECGRHWAYETFTYVGLPECPVCTGKIVHDLRASLVAAERRVSALRGAITRTGKKRK